MQWGREGEGETNANVTQHPDLAVAAAYPPPVSYHQAKLYPRILAAMKPGATLGLSHGFLLGVMKNDGVDFRKDINVVLVAPKVREFRV